MALWTPSQISTALWLDAADSTTLYDATSGGSLVAADGTVARWEDKSGNARHATQATSLNQPLRKTAYEGGRDSILFDGSNDALSLAANLSIGTHTVFVVARNTATITAASSAQLLLSGGSYTAPSITTSEWLFGSGSLTGNLTNERLWNIALADWVGFGEIWGYGKTNADISAAIIAVSSYSPGGTFVGKMNGSADYTSVSSRGAFSSTNTRHPTLLRGIANRFSNTSAHWSGTISEVVVVTSILSSGDIEKVEGYLAHKWGMTANLPGGHPYKSVAPRSYKYPSLRTTLPVAGYYAMLDAGAAASDQFTADGTQDGTLTNGATRSGSPLAYSFDGTNDYIAITDSAALQTQSGASGVLTLSAWVYPTSFSIPRTIVGKYTSGGGANNREFIFGVGVGADAGKLWFQAYASSSSDYDTAITTSALTLNTWFHVAVTFDNSLSGITNKVRLYINGVLQSVSRSLFGGTFSSIPNSTGNWNIGAYSNGTEPWSGLIDDVIIYGLVQDATNIAFLASQRGAIYALGPAGGGPINSQSLIRPADSKPYQQLIGA
jgi:hypothetical protein